MKNYILSFVFDGLLGFFLQVFAYFFTVYIFNNKKIELKKMIILSIVVSVVVAILRYIPVISVGYHTILNIIIIMFISVRFLDASIFPTTISVLVTTIMILIFELINIEFLILCFGRAKTLSMLIVSGVENFNIIKCLLGLLINIIVLILLYIFYKTKNKITKRRK